MAARQDAPIRPQPDWFPGPDYASVPSDQDPLSPQNDSASTAMSGPASLPGDQRFRSRPGITEAQLNAPGSRNMQSAPTSTSLSSSHSSGTRSVGEKHAHRAMVYHSYGDYVQEAEDDDWLHNPDAAGRRKICGGLDCRGFANLLTLALLAAILLMLFAGYPVLTFFERNRVSKKGGYGLGGTNASGQVPDLPIGRALIDPDTPRSAYTRKSIDGKKNMNLVFSDEFNLDGRSFYPGDDPFWTAVDLNYAATGNYEWYSPEAVTTRDGALRITMTEETTNNLNFRSGMVATWNQFCFTGGYIEVSVVMPGAPDAVGLWPAAWLMGNLGRAGYGATTEGTWPYTFDTCDVGTLKNQTYPTGGPVAAETTGVWVKEHGPGVSYLPGQRLSRCTCDGEDHPGPKHSDGSYVGRSAPEIDIFEVTAAYSENGDPHASLSCQLAPFDDYYYYHNSTSDITLYDNAINATLNSYRGGIFQEAASATGIVKKTAFEQSNGDFDTYAFEYRPGSDENAYITWTIGGEPAWTMHASAIGPNEKMEIGPRLVPAEPMYIILNLGISSGFTSYIAWDKLKFPMTMSVDYVRVWQPEGEENVGCDPEDFPTADYIERHAEAYWNANLTTWAEPRERGGYAKPFPKNRLKDEC